MTNRIRELIDSIIEEGEPDEDLIFDLIETIGVYG